MIFKAGSTFSKQATLLAADGAPFVIPSGSSVRAQVRKWPLRSGAPLAEVTVTLADQMTLPGQMTLTVLAATTAVWPPGKVALDIVLDMSGNKRISSTCYFDVEAAVTHD